jgi:hypothetical protein
MFRRVACQGGPPSLGHVALRAVSAPVPGSARTAGVERVSLDSRDARAAIEKRPYGGSEEAAGVRSSPHAAKVTADAVRSSWRVVRE